MKGLAIDKVLAGSIAEELGIEAGDRLLSIDGHSLRDIIDYHYWCDGEQLILEVEKPDGSLWECEVEQVDESSLGMIFQSPIPKQCRNKCIFCFVHQLPK